ncbi:hypothetical protein M427DRAFT_55352, partial [Gonapodya prolifera JEL478]
MFRKDKSIKDAKEAAELWKALPQEEKEEYEAEYKQALDKYKLNVGEWQETHPPEKKARKEAGTSRKKVAKEGVPKHPTTSYLLFKLERGITDVKEAGEAWKSLSAEERAVYEEKSAEDRKRYQAELAAWKNEHPGEEPFERKTANQVPGESAKKPAKPKKVWAEGEPRPPVPVQTDFAKSHGKGMKEGMEAWNAMTVEQKKPWVDRYKERKLAYEKEKLAWEAKQRGENTAEGASGGSGEEEV